MNAAEQSIGLEWAGKIAAVVSLFKRYFPDVRADLNPWRNDPTTRAVVDPDSLDMAFHLPGWSPRYQCRSLLVQIRFYGEGNQRHLLGLEVAGMSYQGEQWRLSTVGNWGCIGEKTPAPQIQEDLRQVCRTIFELFRDGDSVGA